MQRPPPQRSEKNSGEGFSTPQVADGARKSGEKPTARSCSSTPAGWFPAMPTMRPRSAAARRQGKASGYRSTSSINVRDAGLSTPRSVHRCRWSSPRAIRAPRAPIKVKGVTPAASACVDHARDSSTSVSPTSKTMPRSREGSAIRMIKECHPLRRLQSSTRTSGVSTAERLPVHRSSTTEGCEDLGSVWDGYSVQ